MVSVPVPSPLLALMCNAAPALSTIGPVPSALVCVTLSVPALIVVPPVKELLLPMVRTAVPFLIRLATPPMEPPPPNA
jgi:hypothetical protein